MVRRHLLPPAKFETFQNIAPDNNNQQQQNYYQPKQSDSMARIIPKSLTISQSHPNVSTNVSYKVYHLQNYFS